MRSGFNIDGLITLVEEGEVRQEYECAYFYRLSSRALNLEFYLHIPLWGFIGWHRLEDQRTGVCEGMISGVPQRDLRRLRRALKAPVKPKGLSEAITRRVEALSRERLEQIMASK